ncbi:hypothetical protein IMZ48_27175 [Candidatus Bathyarchaeota archaeon]|nr:hypothetical protein [Candidatus Bathyarchaeota archaeon]
MRTHSSADSRDSSGGFRAPASSAPDALQMSYCLVSEEEMDASVEQGAQPVRYVSPHRSKRPPMPSQAKPPQNEPESLPADPSPHRTSPDTHALRRESSQTVKPGGLGFAAPPSPPAMRSSPAMTPSVPEDSITMSDLSFSASRHDSPVASFSEFPLSRVPSVPDNNGANDSTGQYSVYSKQELVMPVITIPHRRPFTETGKSIGRLKILVAGRKGTLLHTH